MGEGGGSRPRGPPRILKHAEGPRSGKDHRVLPPLLTGVGGARGVEADGGGASAGAAAISGPIAGAAAVIEVARVAALGRLLGCGGATPSPSTPP
jgi:hypothetical protein